MKILGQLIDKLVGDGKHTSIYSLRPSVYYVQPLHLCQFCGKTLRSEGKHNEWPTGEWFCNAECEWDYVEEQDRWEL